uniref:F-box domain-containing protein n=1 Tax=Mycena chlorophos TaxID=658473 RepID=A0ABQ0LKB2_MYCCL|nr:predicted protein [Mycena chlorophos]
MPRVVVRATMEDSASTIVPTTLATLPNELLLEILDWLQPRYQLELVGLSRRFRDVFRPQIFSKIVWAPGNREFPPQSVWPIIRTIKLLGERVPAFTNELRHDLAVQLRAALPSMGHLDTFTVGRDVVGGIWSELLDALCAAPAPILLYIDASWLPDEDPLPPRTTPLPLKGLIFPFPTTLDEKDEARRRNHYFFQVEVPNLRTILMASTSTMSSLVLPGELFRLLQGTAWDALTELRMRGFWPLLYVSDSESEGSSGDDGYFTDESSYERFASTTVSLPHFPPAVLTTTSENAAVELKGVVDISSESVAPGPPAPTIADPALEVSEDEDELHLPLPLPSPTALPSTIPSTDALPGLPMPPRSPKTSVEPHVASSDTKNSVEPLIEDTSGRPPTPAVFPDAPVGTSTDSATKTAVDSAAKPPGVVETRLSTPAPERSPFLSVLEAMPNLRKLNLLLRHHDDDDSPSGGFICASDGPSVPKSPDTFLRRLVEFQVTSLSPEDRTVEFLPADLKVFSLEKYPRIPEVNAFLVEPSVAAVLRTVECATFPLLRTLKLWYVINKRQDLALEERLLGLLPKQFPLVETFELFRGWNHDADSLAGLWDPVPLMKKLVSKFKRLKYVAIDLDLPERYRAAPVITVNREFREFMVRVHGMATEIVSEAPWVQRIQIYRELGRYQNYFWEIWGVVVGADGEVKLDRPPPLISDNPFYPDPWFPPNDLVDSDSDESSSNEADAS